MKKKKSDYELRQGQRLVVLLLIALLVAGFSSYDCSSSVHPADEKQHVVIWLNSDSGNFGEGVWQIPAKTSLSDLQALLGVHSLSPVPETSSVQPFGTLSCSAGKLDNQDHTIHHKLAPLVFKPLSLNRADAETLTTLDGIGASLAGKIINLRERIGRFDTPDQLLQVKGIGEKSLASLVSQVSVD